MYLDESCQTIFLKEKFVPYHQIISSSKKYPYFHVMEDFS